MPWSSQWSPQQEPAHTRLLRALFVHIDDFKRPNSSDLFVALTAQKQKIPILIIKHDKDLFESIVYKYNLWDTETGKKSDISQLNTEDAKKIKWSVYT